MTHQEKRILYRINDRDYIVSVDDAWDRFAVANGAPELSGQNVIDCSLWNFISGDMTKHVYQTMLRRVRSGESLRFDFRCDSPHERRFLKMLITPRPDGEVQFETRTKRVEARPSQSVFLNDKPMPDDLVVMCSWCNKVKIDEDSWLELEQAVGVLKLFERHPSPHLSHGMCGKCYRSAGKK